MKQPVFSDAQLLQLLTEDSSKAFKILFDQYYGTLVRVLVKYSKDTEQIKDWIQEVNVKIWENRKTIQFDAIDNFKGYLIVTARNHAIKSLGKKKQLELIFNDQMVGYEIADNNLIENLERAELLEAYHAALTKLPPQTHKAYFLNREQGLSYSKIAEELGISIKTVETQISRAMSILRQELNVYLQ
jgi:RNA polymerase sigma-70 factor (ECF subfamily)